MKRFGLAVLMLVVLGLVAQTPSPPARGRLWLPMLLKTPRFAYRLPLIARPLRTPEAGVAVVPSPTPPGPPTPAPSARHPLEGCRNIVHRQGEQLILNGEPITFVGINATCLIGPDMPEVEICRLLDAVAGWGANLIRVWVKPGESLDRLEYILDQAGPRGLRLVVTLQDYYSWKSMSWFTTHYKKEDLPHIEQVVTRFRDRPEIAIWEVMNEPWCGANQEFDDPNCYRALQAWAADTSGLIRRLDPCRPISLGTMGKRNTPTEVEGFRLIHSVDTVDIVSIHRVPVDWYLDPGELRIAHELGKPLMIGEVFERAYDERCDEIRKDAVADRARKLDQDMRKALELGVDAYLLWNLAPGYYTSISGKVVRGCGVYDYYRDDPVGKYMQALPLRREPVSR